MEQTYHTTDAIIVGAGPVGLFAVFELGLLDMKAHLVDILGKPGGQCAELYPEKPIYDIPAWPVISGQELTDKLLQQIAPFKPTFHYGQLAASLTTLENGHWQLTTDTGTVITAPVIVIAAGGGSFVPKNRRCPASSSSRAPASTTPCAGWRISATSMCWSPAAATARSTGCTRCTPSPKASP